MSGYVCLLCDGDRGEVISITTSLQTGQTVALCAADFPVGMIGGLATELGVDPSKLYEHIKRWVDREAAKQVKAARDAGETERECVVCGELFPIGELAEHQASHDAEAIAEAMA